MGREKKNLIGDGDQYNAYYGNFRGVDFSSDHTQVDKRRFAYLVNMYKDYQSAQGQAIETIPGFRKVVEFPRYSGNLATNPIYGVHEVKLDWRGKLKTSVLIHMGNKLYLWDNYPKTMGVELQKSLNLPRESANTNGTKTFEIVLDEGVHNVLAVQKSDGEMLVSGTWSYNTSTKNLVISAGDLSEGDTIGLSYHEGWLNSPLFDDMNEQKSTSFVFNNKLYLLDGKNYLVYNGVSVQNVLDIAYIPTTYRKIVPGETEISDAGEEYEQRNILQPKFKNTFVADGATLKYYLNEKGLERIYPVEVYGKMIQTSEYTVDLAEGSVTFTTAPKKPEDEGFPEGHAGVVITGKKTFKTEVRGATGVFEEVDLSTHITRCTLACVFDNRVFFSGNPDRPNHIFYCENNSETGYIDPTYFGMLNYSQDGTGIVPVTGMLPVANTLVVLKADSQEGGAIYYHTPQLTGNDIQPKHYPAASGLPGIGCVGTCANFLDDPVFISKLGLEGIGQLSTRNERAIEHRSSLVDAKLTNLDLSGAQLQVWNGYLLLLIDGKIFMADSRQRYVHESGVMQYEWYYLEEIGEYLNQAAEYVYSSRMPEYLKGKNVSVCATCKLPIGSCACEEPNGKPLSIPIRIANAVFDYELYETLDLRGKVVNKEINTQYGPSFHADVYEAFVEYEENGEIVRERVIYNVHEVYDYLSGELIGYEALYCEPTGAKVGGVFDPAHFLKAIDDNLYFASGRGMFVFNFDKRGENGEIPAEYYTFNGRTIFSGCATKMDDCDIPHLTKSTVKKSTVIKTKTLDSSALKIKVRTNKKPYEQISRVNTGRFSFGAFDFADLTFNTQDHGLSTVREKEKKWVEKQYFIYSDEFMKPFAIYNLAYRYKIAGRYKE